MVRSGKVRSDAAIQNRARPGWWKSQDRCGLLNIFPARTAASACCARLAGNARNRGTPCTIPDDLTASRINASTKATHELLVRGLLAVTARQHEDILPLTGCGCVRERAECERRVHPRAQKRPRQAREGIDFPVDYECTPVCALGVGVAGGSRRDARRWVLFLQIVIRSTSSSVI